MALTHFLTACASPTGRSVWASTTVEVSPTQVIAPAVARRGQPVDLTAFVDERSSCDSVKGIEARPDATARTVVLAARRKALNDPNEACDDSIRTRQLAISITPTAAGKWLVLGIGSSKVLATVEVGE